MWRWREKKLTDEQANGLLYLLSNHFGQSSPAPAGQYVL